MSALAVRGTTVEMTVGVDNYHLNLYQPFVLASAKTIVYIVDQSGLVWQASMADVKLVQPAQVSIPVVISPNPDLSLTY